MKKLHWGTGLVPGLYGFLRWLVLALLLTGAASSALAAKTYSDNGDGTVTDPTTGLIWMRCSMGQTWDGATCTGMASSHTWDQASALTGTVTFAGQSDWRLPNIRELQTIVDRSVYNPAIDAVAFPNTPSSYFWSASAYAFNSDYAWYVHFYYGYASYYFKGSFSQVRLVRAGQSFGLLDIARPSTDYVDQGNGTVAHTPTGLTWQRCAVGQTWTGSACSGTASSYNWDAAILLTSNFAGQSDWRLPTAEELLSLVDYSRVSPAINTTLFPNAPASGFWSASASAYDSGGAWDVVFVDGFADDYDKSFSNQVRLVRAGQCFGPLVLTVSKNGTGQVTSTLSTGISCDAVSGNGYYVGDVVTLKVTPVANFISWGGACASAGTTPTCVVTMDGAKSVTASFKDTPLVTVAPTALTFASKDIGTTSTVRSSTLSNTGTATLNISGILASGDYARTTTCGATLAAGANCAISVTFTPTAAGTRTGAITISSNASGSPHSVSLNGTGVLIAQTIGAISFSPNSLRVGGTTTISAIATSGLGVTFTGMTSGICTVYGNVIVGVSVGECTVAANQPGNAAYKAAPQVTQSISVTAAIANSVVSGGTWALNQGLSGGFIPTTGHPKSPPNLPPGFSFPNGLFDFTLDAGAPGSTAIVTITYPSALPAGTVYWKYGRTANNPTAHWYQFAGAVISGKTVTLSITDNADGDDAYTTPGVIADPGGPGVPDGSAATSIPTLSEWGLMILSGLLALGAFVVMRRRQI